MRVISYPETQFIKKSTHYILVSILTIASFVHANAQVAISGTDDSESSVTTFDDKGMTSQPEDSIDYASLEQANQGSASSSTSWTIGEDLAAVVGAVALVAGGYYGYRYYNTAAEKASSDLTREGSGDSAHSSNVASINARGDGAAGLAEDASGSAQPQTSGDNARLNAQNAISASSLPECIKRELIEANYQPYDDGFVINAINKIKEAPNYHPTIRNEQVVFRIDGPNPNGVLKVLVTEDGVPVQPRFAFPYTLKKQEYIRVNIMRNEALSFHDRKLLMDALMIYGYRFDNRPQLWRAMWAWVREQESLHTQINSSHPTL